MKQKKKIQKWFKNNLFEGSERYWESRYRKGGNSGIGSYYELAKYKAKILNEFVSKNNIASVLEFGCGDGNQVGYANYKNYIGLDVSPTIISTCIEKFKDDNTKSFFAYSPKAFKDNHNLFKSELTLSLDVIYHLVEDSIFHTHIYHLFAHSNKYVIIYSSNFDKKQNEHVKHREFTGWIEKNIPEWTLISRLENELHYDKEGKFLTYADFYFYEKK